MTCRITRLHSAKLTSLTKTFCGPDLDVQPFKIGKDFVVVEEPVSDLKSLANLLQRLENEPTQAIIRGSLIAGKKNHVSRNKETFAATARQWCMIDIDSLVWDGDIQDHETNFILCPFISKCFGGRNERCPPKYLDQYLHYGPEII